VSAIEKEVERRFYAARVPIAAFLGADTSVSEERLVVVYARSADDARRESALIDAEFHEASEDELMEWDRITEGPLDLDEIERITKYVRRQLRELANAAARRVAFPKPEDDRYAPADLYKAVRLVELRGKVELLVRRRRGGRRGRVKRQAWFRCPRCGREKEVPRGTRRVSCCGTYMKKRRRKRNGHS